MIQRNIISRKYHSWFKWDTPNANQFFSLFGDEFLRDAKEHINENSDLRRSIQKFMELGDSRNRLFHQYLASFLLEKTSEDIYSDFLIAQEFIDWFPSFINNFTTKIVSNDVAT